MSNYSIVAIAGLICITALAVCALFSGNDGVALTGAVSAVSGIVVGASGMKAYELSKSTKKTETPKDNEK